MAKLIRVINGKKWGYTTEEFKRIKTIPAQPIGDLVANKDTLSLYRTTEDDVRKLPSELIAGYAVTRLNFQQLEVVLIDEREFVEKGLSIKDSPGNTPCKTTNDAHIELVNLKAKNLLSIAQIIFRNIQRKNHLRQYNDNEIAKIVREHVVKGKITKKGINNAMKKELGIIPKCPTCNH